MSEDKQYNGWANYETWCVNLWMDNEEGGWAYWREIAEECLTETVDPGTQAYLTHQERAAYLLADRIKAAHEDEDANPLDGKPSVYSDLLTAALSEVDWREIAEHYIEDAIDDGWNAGPDEDDEEESE